ncbi:MAG: hypothetical protein ACHP65_10480, partial [Legionellales bacterium]
TSDPLYSPTSEQQKAALDFFKIVSPLPNANGDYCCYVSDGVTLVGHDYESVTCPLCDHLLEITGAESEAGKWWDDVLDNIEDHSDLEPVMVTIPCCHAQIQLINLKFDSTVAGFTKFELGALEPNGSEYWENEEECPYYGVRLKLEVIAKFEQILGSPVSQLWKS